MCEVLVGVEVEWFDDVRVGFEVFVVVFGGKCVVGCIYNCLIKECFVVEGGDVGECG